MRYPSFPKANRPAAHSLRCGFTLIELPAVRPFDKLRIVRQRKRAAFRGFTLIELLVVISIIGVLVGLLIPALAMAREAANNALCKSKMHQMHVASMAYGADNRAMPSGRQYETQQSCGTTLTPNSPVIYMSIARTWTYGPGVTTKTIAGGYLPRDKDVAWCPSKVPGDVTTAVDYFRDRDIDHHEWGKNGTPYGVNGQVFLSSSTSDLTQYNAGGAIPMAKWERYAKAYYISECNSGGHMLLGKGVLDPQGANRTARHSNGLNVLMSAGNAAWYSKTDLDAFFDKGGTSLTDPGTDSTAHEFLWGE